MALLIRGMDQLRMLGLNFLLKGLPMMGLLRFMPPMMEVLLLMMLVVMMFYIFVMFKLQKLKMICLLVLVLG